MSLMRYVSFSAGQSALWYPPPPVAALIARQLSIVSISSDDTASTVSFHELDVADDPEDMWMALGLIALETPAQPRL